MLHLDCFIPVSESQQRMVLFPGVVFDKSLETFLLSQLGRGSYWYLVLGARDAAKNPIKCRTDPTTKNGLGPHTTSASVEKLMYVILKLHNHFIDCLLGESAVLLL